jgi:sphingosine kinase
MLSTENSAQNINIPNNSAITIASAEQNNFSSSSSSSNMSREDARSLLLADEQPIHHSSHHSQGDNSASAADLPDILFENEQFLCKNLVVKLIVRYASLTVLVPADPSVNKTFTFDDIIGSTINDKNNSITITQYVQSHSSSSPCSSGPTDRIHQSLTLHSSNPSNLSQLQTIIKQILAGLPATAINQVHAVVPSRFVLILVNPASGSGAAYERALAVEKLFIQSGLEYRLELTQHANHALEMMKTFDFSSFSRYSIVCVSGDGLIYEVVNGFMSRKDWAQLRTRVDFGTIGGGSGNGLCKSLLSVSDEKYSPLNAAFLVVKGQTRPLDLFSCAQPGQPLAFGFLSLSWAIISDIDLESERWRCCGGARFTFAALYTMLCDLKNYNAELCYLPVTSVQERPYDKRRRKGLPHYSKCDRKEKCLTCLRDEKQAEVQQLLHYIAKTSSVGQENGEGKGSESDDSAEEEKWVRLEDTFTGVWVVNTAWCASDMYTAPLAHISDGYLDAIFIRRLSKFSLLNFFLGIEDGSHINNVHTEYVKCKAFRLKSLDSKPCIFSIDGERLPEGELELRCWRGVINIISR